MPGIEGKRLREWRRARGWDVPQLARQLRRAAKEPVAAHDGLVRMIRSWERGTHVLSERYELLYRSLGFGGAAAPALDALFSQLVAYLPDTRPAERFQIALRTLRDTDNLFGPRDVIPLAMRQLAVMRDLSAALRGRDHRDLMLPQIQFADLLGWLYQDTCDFDAALHWLDRAFEWARVLGDQDCVAFILARKSQLACDVRDAGTAIATAGAAMRLTGRQGLIGAVAATYAAHGHALAGDAATTDRLYDRARASLRDTGARAGTGTGTESGTGTPWGKFLDSAYIDVYQAQSLAVLGDRTASAAGFKAAIAGLRPEFHRDRGVYLAREAVARAGTGEHNHAAELALQSLAIGVETRSGRIFAELAHARKAMAPAKEGPAVAQFRATISMVEQR
jgi:transcriptional regulator with XRE-family HTH domain